MRQGQKLTRLSKKKKKEKLLEYLRETSGIVAYACEKAGVSRVTYYNWYKEDPVFAAKADDIQEIQIDFAEASLLKKIKNEDTTAIIFYLKTKGKDRGYTERKEVSGIDGKSIAISQEIDFKNLSDEELATIGKLLEKSKNEQG